MKSQVEQIKEAQRAYVIQITQRSSHGMTDRYSVYLQAGEEPLAVLWPWDTDREKLLPGQVYYRRQNNTIPAYHFAIQGVGFCKYDEIRRTLQEINPNLEVMRLNPGWSPNH